MLLRAKHLGLKAIGITCLCQQLPGLFRVVLINLLGIKAVGCQAKRVETRGPSLEDVFFKATTKALSGLA